MGNVRNSEVASSERLEGSEAARWERCEGSEVARWKRWESSEVVRWEVPVSFKGGVRRVNLRFHLFGAGWVQDYLVWLQRWKDSP